MKLKTIAAVCAMAFAGQAFALSPTVTTAASTTPLFISGSSALQVTIGQIATSLFAPGTIDVYFDQTGNGANYRAYSGTFKSGITGITAGTNGVIYEMAKGGSLMGIIPVATATAVNTGLPTTQILDMTTCTSSGSNEGVTGAPLWNCTGSKNAVADAGVSDVEPAMFQGINIPAGSVAATPAIVAALNAKPSLAQPMAIILTPNAGISSLSKAQVTALMNGTSSDWSYVDASLAAGPVVVCRRVAGSGTQASINDFFFGFPCSSSQQVPATASGNGTAYTVIENSGSGQLAACMTAVVDGTAPGYTIDITSGTISTAAVDATHITLPAGGRGIGLMGLDRQPGTVKNAGINGSSSTVAVPEQYIFSAIGGVAATVENATTGAYDVVVNNSWNNRLGTVAGIAPLSGTKLAFYNAMKANSGNPAILGAAKTPAVPGVAALANANTLNYDPTTVVYKGQTILLNPVMRTDKADSCQPAQQVQ